MPGVLGTQNKLCKHFDLSHLDLGLLLPLPVKRLSWALPSIPSQRTLCMQTAISQLLGHPLPGDNLWGQDQGEKQLPSNQLEEGLPRVGHRH